jgi:hypothetical protein
MTTSLQPVRPLSPLAAKPRAADPLVGVRLAERRLRATVISARPPHRAEALIEGVNTEDGQDALLDVARFAGCSAMSAAFAAGNTGGGFENVAAVATALARA